MIIIIDKGDVTFGNHLLVSVFTRSFYPSKLTNGLQSHRSKINLHICTIQFFSKIITFHLFILKLNIICISITIDTNR